MAMNGTFATTAYPTMHQPRSGRFHRKNSGASAITA
jgi:hypothetical protein